MKILIKSIALFLLVIAAMTTANGQDLLFVEIGVNGLHCSACSFTVEKSIKKVEGVRIVEMDLNERSGKIYLSDERPVPLQELAKAVTKAGYSVRHLTLHFKEQLDPQENCHWQNLCLNINQVASKDWKILGELYMPKKEWKKIADQQQPQDCKECQPMVFLSNIQS